MHSPKPQLLACIVTECLSVLIITICTYVGKSTPSPPSMHSVVTYKYQYCVIYIYITTRVTQGVMGRA